MDEIIAILDIREKEEKAKIMMEAMKSASKKVGGRS